MRSMRLHKSEHMKIIQIPSHCGHPRRSSAKTWPVRRNSLHGASVILSLAPTKIAGVPQPLKMNNQTVEWDHFGWFFMIIVDIVIYCGGCQLLDFCWYHWSNPWPVAPGLMVHLSKELLGSGRYEHMEYVDSPHCCVIIHHPTWKPCSSCSTYGHGTYEPGENIRAQACWKPLQAPPTCFHNRLHTNSVAESFATWLEPHVSFTKPDPSIYTVPINRWII